MSRRPTEPVPCGLAHCERPADFTRGVFAGDDALCRDCAARDCCLTCAARGLSIEIGECDCPADDLGIDESIYLRSRRSWRRSEGLEHNQRTLARMAADERQLTPAGQIAKAQIRSAPDATVASEIGARS